MPDIETIRREIDGLHEEMRRCAYDPLATSGEVVSSEGELRSSLFRHWPAISAALRDMSESLDAVCAERDALLAECETLRRKAEA